MICGEPIYPKVIYSTTVIYRYKRFGIFNCRGVAIVTCPDEDLEKVVREKTGHKKITILEHT